MDSKKLSYDALSDEACLTASRRLGWKLGVNDGPQRAQAVRDELKRIDAAFDGALAQQAQPLTDEQIRRKAHDWNPDASHAFSEGAKWARDRMAQQAQPECKHGVESYCCRSVRSELCVHDVPAQQAQPEYEKESDAARESADGTSARRMAKWGESHPEMPTPEMIAYTLSTHDGIGYGRRYLEQADAVLALFARKDEIIPQNWTPNGLTQEDRDERDAGRIPGSAFRSSLHDDR